MKDKENLPALASQSNAVASFEHALDYSSRELLDALKQTVAKGTSDPEFKVFIELCKSSGFNPLKKEIWCFKSGDKLITMAGINGFFERANEHPAYDGMEIECDNELNPTWVKCKVYRKDRSRPTVGMALLKEFKKGTPLWSSSPFHMLSKVAKAIALREAFPQKLSGIYAPEEIEGERPSKLSELRAIEVTSVPVPAPEKPAKDPGERNNKLQALLTRFELKNVTKEELEDYLKVPFQHATGKQLNNLVQILDEMETQGVHRDTWFKPDNYVPGFDGEVA